MKKKIENKSVKCFLFFRAHGRGRAKRKINWKKYQNKKNASEKKTENRENFKRNKKN